jgi:hypothetical protein
MNLEGWRVLPVGLILVVATVLLAVWWRQQTYRWALVVVLAILAAPALSLWSAEAFQVADYRAGCDGICAGFRGAPIPVYASDGSGYDFLPGGFAVNSLAYCVIILGWGAVVQALLKRIGENARNANLGMTLAGAALLIAPVALSPWFLPAPEAHVRGDSLRVAINAAREVYMYDQESPVPVLHVALNDVRPRPDGLPGMRVCLRTYTFFYLPAGHLFLDMTQEGVHSNGGGFLPIDASCWE